jgi:hypothetical protein
LPVDVDRCTADFFAGLHFDLSVQAAHQADGIRRRAARRHEIGQRDDCINRFERPLSGSAYCPKSGWSIA